MKKRERGMERKRERERGREKEKERESGGKVEILQKKK